MTLEIMQDWIDAKATEIQKEMGFDNIECKDWFNDKLQKYIDGDVDSLLDMLEGFTDTAELYANCPADKLGVLLPFAFKLTLLYTKAFSDMIEEYKDRMFHVNQ